MATSTMISRTVIDHEPGCMMPVTVAVAAEDERVRVKLVQNDDLVMMSVEHAEAVHAALGALLVELEGSPA